MFKVGVGRVELRSSLTGSTRPGPYQMEELTIGSHTANGAPSSWQIQSSEGGTARNGASSTLGISGHLHEPKVANPPLPAVEEIGQPTGRPANRQIAELRGPRAARSFGQPRGAQTWALQAYPRIQRKEDEKNKHSRPERYPLRPAARRACCWCDLGWLHWPAQANR